MEGWWASCERWYKGVVEAAGEAGITIVLADATLQLHARSEARRDSVLRGLRLAVVMAQGGDGA